uniref:V-type proton ATPase subunit E n=1 Tax=Lygus hesperus TaxID=30085 RepID=A0A0A9XBJ9_LYGHE
MCGTKGLSKIGLRLHYTSDHGIPVETKHLRFENVEEFVSWKADIEKKTSSRFFKKTGTKTIKMEDKKVEYYQCHRNGVYKSRGTGKRKIKLQSSNKIDGFCPAAITAAYLDPEDTVDVSYTPTHVGHGNDLRRVNLTREQKKMLAEKIESNVPFDQILGEVGGNVSEERVERIHLLKRRDLHNIKRNLNSSRATQQSNSYGSFDSWAKNNMNTGLVRFYKPRGVPSSSYPNLAAEDFLMVIANDAQLNLLEMYGQDCVCFYGSGNLDNCDFQLTTILVLDELHQAIPCALMFSSKSEVASLSIFISVLRNILKGSVSPKVLVVDITDDYRNAWNSVMAPAAYELFSDKQVVQSWRENLRKIKGEKKQKETLARLQGILQEKNRGIFSTLLGQTLAELDADEDTSEYAIYFRSEFLAHVRCWAHCYRNHLGFDDNVKIENLHLVLMYINRHCKRVKRLDVAVHSMMNFIREKLYKRTAFGSEVMESASIAIMKDRHQNAVDMIGVQIQRKGDTWVFSKSLKSTHKFEIVRSAFDCNCSTKCEKCKACVHMFRCSCQDFAISWNVCKHIHRVAMHCQQDGVEAVSLSSETSPIAAAAVPQVAAPSGSHVDPVPISAETALNTAASITKFETVSCNQADPVPTSAKTSLITAATIPQDEVVSHSRVIAARISAETSPISGAAFAQNEAVSCGQVVSVPVSGESSLITAASFTQNEAASGRQVDPAPISTETFITSAGLSQDEAVSGDLFLNIFDDGNPETPEQMDVNVFSEDMNASTAIEEIKRRLISSFKELVERHVNTLEHVEICENAISSILPTIEATRTSIPNAEFAVEDSSLWPED